MQGRLVSTLRVLLTPLFKTVEELRFLISSLQRALQTLTQVGDGLDVFGDKGVLLGVPHSREVVTCRLRGCAPDRLLSQSSVNGRDDPTFDRLRPLGRDLLPPGLVHMGVAASRGRLIIL